MPELSKLEFILSFIQLDTNQYYKAISDARLKGWRTISLQILSTQIMIFVIKRSKYHQHVCDIAKLGLVLFYRNRSCSGNRIMPTCSAEIFFWNDNTIKNTAIVVCKQRKQNIAGIEKERRNDKINNIKGQARNIYIKVGKKDNERRPQHLGWVRAIT